MKFFFAIIRNVILSKWTFKFNMLLESVESVVALLVQLLVWVALFASNNNKPVAGYSISDLITYTIISRLSGMIMGAKFAVSFAGSIQSGDIAMNFIRKYPPRIIFIFQSIGNSCVRFLTVGVPTLLIAIFLLPDMKPPASGMHFLFFLISVLVCQGDGVIDTQLSFMYSW